MQLIGVKLPEVFYVPLIPEGLRKSYLSLKGARDEAITEPTQAQKWIPEGRKCNLKKYTRHAIEQYGKFL